ncbi:type II toxin-antitoxin system VapC family toxin [Mesorhizobium sp. CN2-181]|uniref:type II toxin-antitoxin system VapC family toxin n=1 Tax=Mesorhizobium yinganensis TaxID=3157707 RepID=UPI0032B819A2
MIFVVDTSAILKWFVEETDQSHAHALLVAGTDLATPDFALIEVANVLWRKQRLGDITETQVDSAISDLPRFFGRRAPSAELLAPALRLARELHHSVYDCMFLALAVALPDAMLVTADQRFLAKTRPSNHYRYLKPLADIPPVSEH